jgi:hypothetical protein
LLVSRDYSLLRFVRFLEQNFARFLCEGYLRHLSALGRLVRTRHEHGCRSYPKGSITALITPFKNGELDEGTFGGFVRVGR